MADIIKTARQVPKLTLFLETLKSAGMLDDLAQSGQVTVFAPNDSAFELLPHGTVDAWLRDIPQLKRILNYHVVPGKVREADLKRMQSLKTVQGHYLVVTSGNQMKINDASLVQTDVESDNGTLHVVDRVLMP